MENHFEVDIFRAEFAEISECVEMQPLQYLAAARVAILVCETDVQRTIKRYSATDFKCRAVPLSQQCWKFLCSQVRGKLNQIEVPNPIIDIILELLWTVSFEISKWITLHAEDIDIVGPLTFCWTSHPKIDYLETTKSFVKNRMLDIRKRFKLACIYCLETEVRYLWELMSLTERRAFFVRGNLNKSDQNPIVLFWTYYIQDVSINQWNCKTLKYAHLFKYSINSGYLSATKFFFGKLSPKTRNGWISNLFYVYLRNYQAPEIIKKDFLAVTCFLMCQLESKKHKSIQYYAMLCLAFRYFLEWPLQKHFVSVIKRMRIFNQDLAMDFRTYNRRAKIFGEMLQAISEKETMGFLDHDYKEIFMEFWHVSRNKFRTFKNERLCYEIFMNFVMKHFGFVFEVQSFALKKKFRAILFQQNASENEVCFETKNVEFFKFLVRERVTTKESIERFNVNWINTFYRLPLGELLYLIDALLLTV